MSLGKLHGQHWPRSNLLVAFYFLESGVLRILLVPLVAGDGFGLAGFGLSSCRSTTLE